MATHEELKDQDTSKAFSPAKASSRLGGVWSSDSRRQLQESMSLAAKRYGVVDAAPSSPRNQFESTRRRREAAAYIQEVTGVAVPSGADNAFRQALRDGVLLCKLLNSIHHNAVEQINEDAVGDGSSDTPLHPRLDNLSAFLAAITAHGDVPPEYLLTKDDLLSSSWEDRPRVATCVLFLKRLACETGIRPHSPPFVDDILARHDTRSPTSPNKQVPLVSATSARGSGFGGYQQFNEQHFAMQQQQQHQQQQQLLRVPQSARMPGPGGGLYHPLTSSPSSSLSSVHLNGIRASSGVQKLMQQCSKMLQQQMGDSTGSGAGITNLCSSASNNMTVTVEVQQQHHQQIQQQQQQHHSLPHHHQYASMTPYGTHGSGMMAMNSSTPGTVTSTAVAHRLLTASAAAGIGGYGVGGGNELDAVGPVLEQVLSGLTQEYEKRLLAKDHEITETKERMGVFSRQMGTLQAQLAAMHGELAGYKSAASSSRESEAAVAALQDQVESLEARLREATAAHGELQRQLDGQEGSQLQQVAELEARLTVMGAELSAAAGLQQRYRASHEECRRLYNQVQDLRGAIRVFCRVRPPGRTGDTGDSCVEVGADGDLAVYDLASSGSGTLGNGRSRKAPSTFKFDRVFDVASTQEQVYEDTQPLIRSVLDGYNVCIFAYGQTGSGKTHTMSGTNVQELGGRGINYRALDDLFEMRDRRADEISYSICVQMLEIYNERLRDLLLSSPSQYASLDILSTQPSGCNVPNAVQTPVTATADIMRMMAHGASNRATAGTNMNDRSSRSHQILTVIVDGVNRLTGARTHGCLHLVDLAGSERVDRSGATGDRLEEAKNINCSLSALGDVMAALAAKSNHVPFRNSKLTQLLQDSLSGNAKVMMFMHVAPEASSASETTSTLNFGQRVSSITLGQAKANVAKANVTLVATCLSCQAKANVQSSEVPKAREELLRAKMQLKEEREARQRLEQEVQALRAQQAQQALLQRTPVQAPPLPTSEASFTTACSVESRGGHISRVATPGAADSATPRNHMPPRSPFALNLSRIGSTPTLSPAPALAPTPATSAPAPAPPVPCEEPAAPTPTPATTTPLTARGGGIPSGLVRSRSRSWTDGGAAAAQLPLQPLAAAAAPETAPPPAHAASGPAAGSMSARSGSVASASRRSTSDNLQPSSVRGSVTTGSGSVYSAGGRARTSQLPAAGGAPGLPTTTERPQHLPLSRDNSVGSGSSSFSLFKQVAAGSSSVGAGAPLVPLSVGGRRASLGGGRWK